MKIFDIVKNKATTEFNFFRDGTLHYKTSTGFDYSIPTQEATSATFNKVEKATLHLKWITQRFNLLQSENSTSEGTRGM